ncbi:phosphatidylinositol-specific phospholipase C/glycerophosphodiester phosphodiesterase family protein [Clostridium sp. MD294]|uniref:phosphatidylinositol-specific phospholipase C/glycerophosphodiester phosphodiesterase family protein n=1 Tax=Clostridium sp. MD294 TaxID=97138 RepID=UPI0002CBC390|nr:phosphatidylinositol-specific phospholipase C/glycerophosphodiester phosphodiesterase family protein [Clostridium sp. MD294]USF28835.1 hypothetical protein C820_000209 [Clostridium sp. MD294]
MKLKQIVTVLFVTVFFCTPIRAEQNKKWYEDNRLVAHALGAIEDKKETNSKEAFIHSWENGYKVMEADFSFTSDGILVVRHDFDQDSYYNLEQKVNGSTEMNSSRFSNEKINFRYTPITATQILALLAEYEDVYLITDTKYTDTQKIQKEFTDIVNAAKAMGREDILNRVVVQIYNTEMLDTVKQIYPFTNWIYTLYQTPNPNYDDIATFCANNGIDVVTINYEIVKKENIQKLTAKGIRVYAHTVNRMLDFKMMLEAGCYGIYTDYIKPYDLDIVNMKKTPFWSGRILVNQKEMAVNFNTIMGKDYIRLRDFASVVSDTEAQFEIKYDSKTNTVNIIKGGVYTSIGNEMLLDNSEKYITKKSNYRIAVDGTAVEAQCYTIDGDLYFDIEQLAQILGMTAQKKQDGKGYIVATIT